ncbi:MAG: hypothetical protein AB7F75_06885 [Planctomycetota bacterium]
MPKLLTEADIRRLKRGGALQVPSGTLITPAARDMALAHGIRLDESRPLSPSRNGTSCGCSDPSSITITLPKTESAEYAVKVSADKVQVLEAGGSGRLLATRQRIS